MVVASMNELQEFQQKCSPFKIVNDKDIVRHMQAEQELIIVNKELTFQNDEKIHKQLFEEPKFLFVLCNCFIGYSADVSWHSYLQCDGRCA